uniref:Uncharacterized protein n=1 Tax=viral metagenome TaxID=1070528 RepID=A0A6C0E4J6_9ZZZZ
MERIFNQESNKKGEGRGRKGEGKGEEEEGRGEERKKKGDLVIVYNYKSGWVVVVVGWFFLLKFL